MNPLVLVLGILAGLSGIGVVMSRQPIYSALSLVLAIGMLAIMFLVLNAQFLFVVQLIVYAGAVMVLFVFIIALLNPAAEERPVINMRAAVALLTVIGITATLYMVARSDRVYNSDGFRGAAMGQLGTNSDPYHSFVYSPAAVNAPDAGNVQTVAGQLFTTFLLPFEITSLLLLVAAIGAVYLTRHKAVA